MQLDGIRHRRSDRNPLLDRNWLGAAQLLPDDRALLGGMVIEPVVSVVVVVTEV